MSAYRSHEANLERELAEARERIADLQEKLSPETWAKLRRWEDARDRAIRMAHVVGWLAVSTIATATVITMWAATDDLRSENHRIRGEVSRITWELRSAQDELADKRQGY